MSYEMVLSILFLYIFDAFSRAFQVNNSKIQNGGFNKDLMILIKMLSGIHKSTNGCTECTQQRTYSV